MHPILFSSLPFQIGLIIHAVKTGRPTFWVWILLIGSWLGVIAYVLVELAPALGQSRGVRRAATQVLDRVAPERRLKTMRDQLELAPTLGNRVRLANECLRLGDYESAETFLREGMTGLYATEADLMRALAEAQAGQGRYAEARTTLDALLAANPDYRSPEAHLLYARCLQEEGQLARALEEFAVVAQSYPGEEGRVRFARLLRQSGDVVRAKEVLEESLRRVRLSPKYYQREQRAWIQAAEQELRTLA